MSEFNQGLMITLVGMLTIFGVLSLLVFASEVLKRVLGEGEPKIQKEVSSANPMPREASFKIMVDDKEYSVTVKQDAVVVDGECHRVSLKPEKSEPSAVATKAESPLTEIPNPQPSAQTSVVAPMSGKIRQIKTREGDRIQKGDVLLTIEIMKMEIEVFAEKAGKVEKILVEVGQTVTLNEPLIITST